MNRRDFVLSLGAGCASAQETGELQVVKGTLESLPAGPKKGVRFPEGFGQGVAYLKGVVFANGAIEVDLKGRDAQQQSFLGVAFHGVDAERQDVVYFRPFNFKAGDPARRIRAVQYVSHPEHPWPKLRTEHPGKYEKAVNPVPDPNSWFHARIVVAAPTVSVFIDGANVPCLVVSQLSDRGKGRVGIWASGIVPAEFANLQIRQA